MAALELLNPDRILDGCVDLPGIPDDPCVLDETLPIALSVTGYPVDLKLVEGIAEGLSFLENGEPGKAGLVDLQNQPLEELVVAGHWKAVLEVMVGTMERMSGSDKAIAHTLEAMQPSVPLPSSSTRARCYTQV
jgi:hypothetical protein